MRCAWCITLGTFVLGMLSACNGSGGPVPLAPSFPMAPPPAVSVSPQPEPRVGRGSVTIRELNPGGGAILGVRSDCLNILVAVRCTDGWRGSFDVLVDLDMTHAVLTAWFYDGDTRCAYAADTMDRVPAGGRVSFTMNRIYLSDHLGRELGCRLPATTNRLEVELWSDDGSWNGTLLQEFRNTYTFFERTAPQLDMPRPR